MYSPTTRKLSSSLFAQEPILLLEKNLPYLLLSPPASRDRSTARSFHRALVPSFQNVELLVQLTKYLEVSHFLKLLKLGSSTMAALYSGFACHYVLKFYIPEHSRYLYILVEWLTSCDSFRQPVIISTETSILFLLWPHCIRGRAVDSERHDRLWSLTQWALLYTFPATSQHCNIGEIP